jgi:hypothetical protein
MTPRQGTLKCISFFILPSSQGLGADLTSTENATGNIAKWAAELAKFEMDFNACHAIKSQVLADFVADWMSPPSHPGGADGSAPKPPAPVSTIPH